MFALIYKPYQYINYPHQGGL